MSNQSCVRPCCRGLQERLQVVALSWKIKSLASVLYEDCWLQWPVYLQRSRRIVRQRKVFIGKRLLLCK